MALLLPQVAAAEELGDLRGQVKAIGRSNAVIEFALDGTIQNANENFLKTVGYSLDEIRGRHHRIFVDAGERESAAYQAFWLELGRGEYRAGQYKRIAKDGREVWLQASYNPILDMSGKPFKVVKYCTDITAQKMQAADFEAQINAIHKTQAVIEFELDGTILRANENFVRAMGYSAAELRGQHHRLFVDPVEAKSPEYAAFWAKLGRGEFDSGMYRRLARGDREIWLQASYNPVFDASGRPLKVVKFATDVTAQKRQTEQLAKLVTQIRSAAGEIQQSAEEISKGNISLSQRVETQAASLQQTSASMATDDGHGPRQWRQRAQGERAGGDGPHERWRRAGRSWAARCRRCRSSTSRAARSATSSASSTPSRSRPTCWRSTRPSRRRARASRARVRSRRE